jgi:hypothetical protein
MITVAHSANCGLRVVKPANAGGMEFGNELTPGNDHASRVRGLVFFSRLDPQLALWASVLGRIDNYRGARTPTEEVTTTVAKPLGVQQQMKAVTMGAI